MATPNDLVLKWYQKAQNSGQQSIYDQEKAKALANANSILAQKYGQGATYDPNKGFYDYGNAQNGYNMNNDPISFAQYQKALSDMQAADAASQQAQLTNANRGQQLQNQAYLQQVGQKYINNNMQAQGLNNSGASETAYAQLRNAYANNVNSINNNYNTNMADLYKQYAQNKQTSQSNLDNSILEYQQAVLENRQNEAVQRIGEATSVEDLEQRYSPYKNVENDYLRQAYQDKYNELQSVANQQKLTAQYGVSNTDQGLDITTLKTSDFKFSGYKNSNSTQGNLPAYLNKMVSANLIQDGDVINVNVGSGKRSNYVYNNGKLYKASDSLPYNISFTSTTNNYGRAIINGKEVDLGVPSKLNDLKLQK